MLVALTLTFLCGGIAGQISDSHPRARPPAYPLVALERRLAERLGARVGDTLEAGLEAGALAGRVVVGAIYEPATDPSVITRREYYLRFHLPDLAALLGTPDRVDRFGLRLVPGVPVDSVTRTLNRVAFGYRAYSSSDIASESSQTFKVVSRFHRAIAVISVMASAIFLLCIMLLKVEERRRDAAVMRFTGISSRTIFGALLLEAILIAALGSAMGVGIAALASATTNAYYQRFFDTALVFSVITGGIVRFSVVLSLGLGLAAGALAAWRLARTRPLVLWGRG
ncbi:MAG TPA: ABC transporter permease [Gemmatimonadales bacterium]|nr:ABC transporter permease [Gemmatimonadales bacterium]